MTSLYRQLKQNIESFGISTINTSFVYLIDEISNIPVKSPRDVNNSVVVDSDEVVSSDNVHVRTTQKLVRARDSLIGQLYRSNVDCEGTENIPTLIDMVLDIIPCVNTSMTINSNASTIEDGESVTITYTLTDANGNNLTNSEYVNVYVDGSLVTTIRNGSYTLSNLSQGTHEVQLGFVTNSIRLYDCTSNILRISVTAPAKTDTTCSLTSADVYAGQKATLTGTLYDKETGEVISGTLYYYEDSTLIGSSESGGSVTTSALSSGSHYFTVQFNGTSTLNNSYSGTSVTVNKYNNNISASPKTAYNGDSVTLKATGYGTVTIKEGSTERASGSGSASYTYTATASKTFKITASGNDTYNSGSISHTITTSNKTYTTTASNVTISTTGGEIGGTGKITATLKNVPTSLKLEIFKVGQSSAVASSTTGSVTYNFTLTSASQSFYVKITGATVNYTEYSTYTSNNYSLTGTKKSTSITKGNGCSGTIYYGWKAYFWLKDSGGNGVSGKTLTASWSGGTTTLTDEGSGKYSLTHKIGDGNASNLYIYTVKFNGDDTYNSSQIGGNTSSTYAVNNPITALPTTTTRIYPSSVVGVSPWTNLKTGNSASDYANCRITSKQAYPTLTINYKSKLYGAYRVTKVKPRVTLALEQNKCESPNQPTIKVYCNTTLVLDNYSGTTLGTGPALGTVNWHDHETESDCSVYGSGTSSTNFTVTIDTPTTVSTAGRLDACLYSMEVTYKQLIAQ